MKKVYLVGRSGIHGNKELLVENEILIGRDASVCQLVYPSNEKGISSVHCKVQNINGAVQLTDMGSTNGTYLDTGVRLAPHSSQSLQSGQGFYLGDKNNSFAIRVQNDEKAYEANKGTGSNSAKGGSKAFSITSMVLGIVGSALIFLMDFIPVIISIICGIVGVVFGAYALYSKRNGKGMAIAGFVCSIVAIAVPLLILLVELVG
ncbi:MAG: FHA domain-containing protein [Lachnospiraceae bacterium]|nr:FHA domain-containing protein [Lachnospiraceae bacterium]